MIPVVRAFVFNAEGDILMARHKPNGPWVLPGGHVEKDEALHDALERELREEFAIDARFFEIDPLEVLSHKGKRLVHHPLPVASYDLTYTDAKGQNKSRTEYIFLVETDAPIGEVDTTEIAQFDWFSPEKVLSMKPNIETWDFYIEMLEKIIGEDELE